MKTSNKILIGLLFLLIAVPISITLIIRNMFSNGHFTDAGSNDMELIGNGTPSQNLKSLGDYKFIKLVGPNLISDRWTNETALMNANIHFSNHPGLLLDNLVHKDSLAISRVGDTLLIRYVEVDTRNSGNTRSFSQINFNLYLSRLVPMILDKAAVCFDEMDKEALSTIKDLNNEGIFYLYNHSKIQIGKKIDNPFVNTADTVSNTTDPLKKIASFYPHLKIHSVNSQVAFFQHPQFDDLFLDLDGNSSILIPEGFSIKKLTGSIDGKANIESAAAGIKKLAPIITQ
ncbi:MAG TPA: hypothetical protein VL053_07570 [Arachidicoccus sp.]|nr:hypothetical protein [Arachidicoccus sp.]